MILIWFKDNLPNRLDIEWFKALGGFIGDKHPSAERMNGGEKAWFWLLVGAGIAVSLSGLILDFPVFGQERWLMQISHVIHVIFSMLLIIGSLVLLCQIIPERFEPAGHGIPWPSVVAGDACR